MISRWFLVEPVKSGVPKRLASLHPATVAAVIATIATRPRSPDRHAKTRLRIAQLAPMKLN
jgi:hypothetical protein